MSIEIIPFSNQYQAAIKRLNVEWLEKFFELEPNDVKSLSNPIEEIINKGGFIFYAKCEEEIVGTYSLLKKEDKIYELGKMAVTETYQGKGIGKIMLAHCIDFAKIQKWNKIILYSNTKLISAIHLYKKHGFVEVSLEPGLYKRADIKMELIIVK